MVKRRKRKLEFCKFCGDPMDATNVRQEFCSSLCRARNFMAIRKGLKEAEEKTRLEEGSVELIMKSGSTTYSELRDKLKK